MVKLNLLEQYVINIYVLPQDIFVIACDSLDTYDYFVTRQTKRELK